MDIDNNKLLEHLKKGLALIGQDNLWPATEIMERIVYLTGDIELEKLLEELNKIVFSYKDEDEKKSKKIYAEFVKKMKGAELKKVVYASGNSST